jgi:outer membrane protein OmpA-like peptidoglycan-associated protein
MKKIQILLVAAVLLTGTGTAHAQFLKRLGDKAKQAAERVIENKTEKAAEQVTDKATDLDTYTGTGQQGNASAGMDVQGNSQVPTGQQGGQSLEMTYAKNDFIPGDEIIFDDPMDNEQLGEFPSMWDLYSGNAEVAAINGKKAIIFPDNDQTIISPLMKDMNNYLPEQYTIEMDLWLTKVTSPANQSEQFYRLDFYQSANDNSRVMQLDIRSFDYYNQTEMLWLYKSSSGQNVSGQGKITLATDGWHHLSISFNKRAFKVYLDGVRIANIPNMSQAARFTFAKLYNHTSSAVTNVRIAKGAVPLYDRMMSEGKFITYGITFDVGKSTIKPESMGEINRILQLMNENPDLKFSVEGHTDSTGNAASNQTLSEARSKAIVDKLVSLGISADRLTSSGKGQNNPIADNSTDEGRAKNRRVEFVKM